MLYDFGYVVGAEGKNFWEPLLHDKDMVSFCLSNQEMKNFTEFFCNKYYRDRLDSYSNEYLVEGIYLRFNYPGSDDKRAGIFLLMKGNSKESVKGLAKKLNLPMNKANLSEQNSPNKR